MLTNDLGEGYTTPYMDIKAINYAKHVIIINTKEYNVEYNH
jgi:hypothetical protein